MPRFLMVAFLFAACTVASGTIAPSLRADTEPEGDQEAAYTRTINERAEKIVATLGIEDAAKAKRVRDLIAENYRNLRQIHDQRDASEKEATKSPATDSALSTAWINAARQRSKLEQNDLHRRFVARLSVELTPERLEGVKNGLTYGVVPITYEGYLKLLPDLTDQQKREILANLIEAREHAMDGGSSEEKHAIFGKYKGRINNYLSSQGFDLKAAEKDLAAKRKSQP
jgi:hypothetical protein